MILSKEMYPVEIETANIQLVQKLSTMLPHLSTNHGLPYAYLSERNLSRVSELLEVICAKQNQV